MGAVRERKDLLIPGRIKMMAWYADIREILRREPETWLAYLYGQQLGTIAKFKRTNPSLSGPVLRLGAVFYFIFRNLGLRRSPHVGSKQIRFMAYIGTINQAKALDTTIKTLQDRGEDVLALIKERIINAPGCDAVYVRYRFGCWDAVKALMLLAVRGRSLYRELRSMDAVAVNWYFNEFCRVYIYLAFFHNLLRETEAEFVITSNDHNVPNRCLLAVAHYFGIKTVYVQHASVTSRFPALRVSFAFLDGRAALDAYIHCEENQPEWERDVPVPVVFLSGQKKSLIRRQSSGVSGDRLGIAVNTLDDPDKVIELVREGARAGMMTVVRWHPGEQASRISGYKAALEMEELVVLCDPRKEDVGTFLATLDCLVASNSSIHLEAALAGVHSVYCEFGRTEVHDYYGYVKHGLVAQARSVSEVLEIVRTLKDSDASPNKDVVRYFSATHNTRWEGREGELVAESLIGLAGGRRAEDVFGFVNYRSELINITD